MNMWHTRQVALVALGGFLLAGCHFPTRPGAACAPEDLVAPVVVSPTDMELVDSLRPMLSWDFPADCRPDAYRIRLYSPGPDFPQADLMGEADGSAEAWSPDTDLEAGTPYMWQVAAISGDTVGPYSPEAPGGLTTGVFWTGPRCAHGDPIPWPPPILLLPSEGEVISTTTMVGAEVHPYVELTWDDPLGCFPEVGYAVEISRFPDFRSLEIDPATPSVFIPRGTFLPWVMPLGWEWETCVPYYWRVRVNLPVAAYSDSRSFRFVPEGTVCPLSPIPRITAAPLVTLASSIAGWTYLDENSNDVREAGEGTVSGALLTLKSGACPGGSEITTVESDSSGRFSIASLAPGDYCLVTSPIQQTLYPESQSVSLAEAEARDDVNFRMLLAPLPPAAPRATFLQNANCRWGPGTDYDVVTSLLAGQEVDIEGRNGDSTWWWIRLPQSQAHCWVAGNVVQTSGDLSTVLQVAAPPKPTATPVQGCLVYVPNLQKNVCTVPCPPNAQPGGVCTP